MLVRRSSCAATIALSAVLAACAATAAPETPSAAPAPAVVTAGVAALATDQACTAHAPAGSTLRTVGFRADDLPAMTIPKSGLGSRVSTYSWDSFHWGYMDNAELGHIEIAPTSTCSLNARHGRITGFARAYAGGPASNYQYVATETDLFFTAAGAASWLTAFVTGLKGMPGSNGVTSVGVAKLSAPGVGARLVSIAFRDGTRSRWLLFRRGPLLGSVINSRMASTTPVIDVKAVARRLSTRMGQRSSTVASRSDSRFDAVMQLSAGLPKAKLGSRYQGMVWDWYFGGCWDPVEGASQTNTAAEARAYRSAAAKYGQLAYCRAMYIPPHDTQVYNRVGRVFTGGTLYATSTGANGALTQVISDWQHRAGTTRGGYSYGALSRFSPGALGDRAVGLQQRMGSQVLIRIYVRYGRYLAVSQLATTGFSGMRTDVKRWASLLDRRVRALMTTRTW